MRMNMKYYRHFAATIKNATYKPDQPDQLAGSYLA